MKPRTPCALVLLAAITGAVAAPLTPEQQQLFRDVHADRPKSSGNQKSLQASRLASQLGREGSVEAAVFLLELRDGVLLSNFRTDFKAPATPELEATALKLLRDPELETCNAATVVRKYQSRALYEALLAESRRKDRGYERCVYAVVNTDLPGIEADLTALLNSLSDYYEGGAVAAFLVRRKYEPAEAALLGWLQRTRNSTVGTAAGIIAPLNSPGMANGLLRRLADMKGLPPSADLERDISTLIAVARYATPGAKIDRSILSDAVLSEFPPEYRGKLTGLLRERYAEEKLANEATPESLKYWIGRNSNERVRDIIRRGADVNATGENANDRPLFASLNARDWEAMRLLLEAGADPNIRDWKGNTPLKLIAGLKPFLESAEPATVAAAKFLIEKGAHVSSVGEDTRTPLHTAVGAKFRPMVVLLVESGADINAEAIELTLHGLTPTLLAEDQKYDEIAAYLRSKGGKVNQAFVQRRAGQRALNNLVAPFMWRH